MATTTVNAGFIFQIVKVLLHNKSKWDQGSDFVDVAVDDDRWLQPAGFHRPILVVCYTNHALDQFLEGKIR